MKDTAKNTVVGTPVVRMLVARKQVVGTPAVRMPALRIQ